MSETPRIPSDFIAPNPYQDWHDAEPQHPEMFGPRASFPPQHDRPDDAPERDAEAAAATPAAAAPPPGPEPMAAGTYAVYDDQAGGYVLVIGTREGETHHKHLPGHLVKMAEKMAGSSPLAALFGAG
jgi:hypothetical protein